MIRVIKEGYCDWKKLCFNLPFCGGLLLMMCVSYATLLHNPTIGIDDTSFDVYYEEGVSPAMGRWVLFLLNKFVPLNYNPYMVEAVGLLVFCISVSIWCLVFYKVFGERIPRGGYLAFGCAMLSNSILAEVVVWYLQDGLYVGYGLAALSVFFGIQAFEKKDRTKRSTGWISLGLSAVFLTAAAGCYESLLLVWGISMLAVFMVFRILRKEDYSVRPGEWLGKLAICGVAAIVLRTAIVSLFIHVFDLEVQTQVLKSRGLHEVLAWFDGTKRLEDFFYVLKAFFVKYYINGIVYLPILLLVLAEIIIGIFALCYMIKRRDGFILLAAVGMILAPWIMPVLEGVATYYRSSQYIPVVTAFAILLLAWKIQEISNAKRLKPAVCSTIRGIAAVLLLILLYHQAYDMNRWFYIDHLKYEDTKNTLEEVALVIKRDHDASKPICVIGKYETPESLLEEAYCPSWSKKYLLTEFLVKKVDESLFEEYNTPYGYTFVETPHLSFISWGATAFYQFDRELIKFWNMHGFNFREDSDLEHYKAAKEIMKGGPAWPKEGSVVEMEDYIIVNFGNGRF